MACCKCTTTAKKTWVFGCGTLIALLALILGLVWPGLFLTIMNSQLVLKEGSLTYKNWIELPIPMYLEIYMFNWDNPDDVAKMGVKPKFTEKGPYVFSEHHRRVDLTWNKNTTISYNQIRTWHFVPEMSAGTLDDKITCPNVLSATVADKVRNMGRAVKRFANFMMTMFEAKIQKTATVREWLFDGYEDELLKFLKKINSSEIDIPFSKFGWFVDRNGSSTYDGRFTMYTGAGEIHNMGILTSWNGVKKTKFYKDTCAMVNGTSGELWPPDMDPDSPKTVFVPDVCRSVTIYPDGRMERFGIKGAKYRGDEHFLDNGEIYPENRCFCKSNGLADCPMHTGILDVSNCKYGAPVWASYPHFYLADPSYAKAVIGMKPDPKKHEFTMALEPITGVPMEVNAQLQVNMLMQDDDIISMYKGVPRKILPLFWFSQNAKLPKNLADQVRMVTDYRNVGLYAAYGLGAVGLLIILVGIILTVTKKWNRRTYDDQEPLSN